ncbi:hypothetical protein C8Q72DRAFT_882261 [Fomitopsis betulina]|nr:hypothetical protein C8Q72DRAFT_882261 [Fomitopsis betulina]
MGLDEHANAPTVLHKHIRKRANQQCGNRAIAAASGSGSSQSSPSPPRTPSPTRHRLRIASHHIHLHHTGHVLRDPSPHLLRLLKGVLLLNLTAPHRPRLPPVVTEPLHLMGVLRRRVSSHRPREMDEPPIKVTLTDMKDSLEFIRLIQEAMLDGSNLSAEVIDRIRNPPQEPLKIDDPDILY